MKLSGVTNTVFTAGAGAIAGGIVTLVTTGYLNQDQNKTRFLDYSVESKLIFRKEKNVLSDKIKVVVDNDIKNPVLEVRQISFTLYNLSDKDFDKVDLSIEMSLKEALKSFKIISQDVPSEYKDNAKSVESPSSGSQSTKKYTYNIETINRSSLEKGGSALNQDPSSLELASGVSLKPRFKVTYTITGEKTSEIDVKPSLKRLGAELRKISYSSVEEYEVISRRNMWDLAVLRLPVLRVLPLILVYLILAYGWFRICHLRLRNRIIQREKVLTNKFEKYFAKSGVLSGLRTIQDPQKLAGELTIMNRSIRNEEDDKRIYLDIAKNLSRPNGISEFRQSTDSEVIEGLLEVDPDPMKPQLNFWEWFRKS